MPTVIMYCVYNEYAVVTEHGFLSIELPAMLNQQYTKEKYILGI